MKFEYSLRAISSHGVILAAGPSDGPVAERTKRDTVTDEYVSGGDRRPAMPEISRDRFRDCGGQRQIDRGAVLQAANMQDVGVPIDILKLEVDNLRVTQAVGAEQETLSRVPSAKGVVGSIPRRSCRTMLQGIARAGR